MSTISYLAGLAIGVLHRGLGSPVIEYRQGTSGSWTAIAAAVFEVVASDGMHDDLAKADTLRRVARLTWPESGPALTDGYQVRYASDDLQIFAVHAPSFGAGQRLVDLVHTDVTAYSANRGARRK